PLPHPILVQLDQLEPTSAELYQALEIDVLLVRLRLGLELGVGNPCEPESPGANGELRRLDVLTLERHDTRRRGLRRIVQPEGHGPDAAVAVGLLVVVVDQDTAILAQCEV